jgi:hypothetical protein
VNYVYVLPNKREETTLRTIQEFFKYVERRWEYKIKILKLDGETSLGKRFDKWVANKGIELEGSALYTPA